jgi:hypothetical protein
LAVSGRQDPEKVYIAKASIAHEMRQLARTLERPA